MKKYNEIQVSHFVGNLSKTVGDVNLLTWLMQKPSCIAVINQIRSSTDKVEIDLLKKKLPTVTVSGIFSERRTSESLVEHSGLICIDIDGKDNLHITAMEDLKQTLSKLSYVLYCGLSVSGKGVFCVIPIANTDKHKEHFFALEEDFQNMGITVDSSCKDVTRLRFCSYDPKPVVNLQATVYEKYMETSSAVRTTRTPLNKRANNVPSPVHVQQEEEKVLSIEEQLLMQTIDMNSNKPIQVQNKNATEKIREFVDYIVAERVDITEIYDDWIAICMVIASNFGEEGRELFQAISQFYTYKPYSPDVCNEKYDDILSRGYHKSVNRLYEIAAKYGL